MITAKKVLELHPAYQNVEVKQRTRDYLIGNQKYQRVSTILGVINKPMLVGWAKRMTLEKVEEVLRNDAVRDELVALHSDGNGDSQAIYEGWVERLIGAAKKASDERRDAAADRGTGIHEEVRAALELQETDYSTVSTSAECEQAIQFVEDTGITVERLEMTVWDPSVTVAGTCDAVGWDAEGKLIIWDWKTGSGPWPEMALQLGAYAEMLEGMTGEMVTHAYIVKLMADRYEVHEVQDLTQAMMAFNTARKLQVALKSDWWS